MNKLVLYTTDTIVQLNSLSADGMDVSLKTPNEDTKNPRGEVLFSGETSTMIIESFDTVAFAQLREWQRLRQRVQAVGVGDLGNLVWYEPALITSVRKLPVSVGKSSMQITLSAAGLDLQTTTHINLAPVLVSKKMVFPVVNQRLTISAVTSGLTLKQYDIDGDEIDSISTNAQQDGRCVLQSTTVADVFEIEVLSNGHSLMCLRTDDSHFYTAE